MARKSSIKKSIKRKSVKKHSQRKRSVKRSSRKHGGKTDPYGYLKKRGGDGTDNSQSLSQSIDDVLRELRAKIEQQPQEQQGGYRSIGFGGKNMKKLTGGSSWSWW